MPDQNDLPITNLRSFLKKLSEKGLLLEINEPLDPNLEIPEVHRRVIDKKGPALFFKNPKGSDFPLVTNLFGTLERVEMAFGDRPKQFVKQAVSLMDELMPPTLGGLWNARHFGMQALKIGMKNISPQKAPIAQSGPQVPFFNRLPITTSWPEDGGPFITLPLVYTEDPSSGHHNLGMYRVHVYDDRTTGMHWQIHKGGGFHHHEAERLNQNLPVVIFNGGPPALMLSAIAPLPEDVPELLLTSLLMGKKLERTKVGNCPLPLIAEAEFAFVGEVRPHERRPEGPFGDHYGYYSLQHDYPVFHAKCFYHRESPIFSATVVGEPRQEDFFIGEYLQDLLSPLFPKVMPAVKDLTTYGETGFHSLAAARVKVRYPREAIGTGMRILGEGQLSLTKVLMLNEADVPFRPFDKYMEYFLERMDFKTDLHVFSCTSQDTLDYTGPKVNEGSKMMMLAMGEPKYDLEIRDPVSLPEGIKAGKLYCPGCLVLETSVTYEKSAEFGETIVLHPSLQDYRMIILVDSLEETLANEMSFLWVVFTRFEPAADIKSKSIVLKRFHPEMEAPVLIDARFKPWYPGKLISDPNVVTQVNQKWSKIFP
jgi:UbiD family decarboxylase